MGREWVTARSAVDAVKHRLYCDHRHAAEQIIEAALREGRIQSRRDHAALSHEDWYLRGTWPEGQYDECGNWIEKHEREQCVEDPLSLDAYGIELRLKDLEKWISSQKPKPSRPPNRSFEKADAPLVEKMHALIENGQASSPTEAARRVIAEHGLKGGGTEDSKVTRLVRRYKAANGE